MWINIFYIAGDIVNENFLAKRYQNSAATPMAEAGVFTAAYDDVINLSLGDPDFNTDSSIIEMAFDDAKKGHTHYTDALGYVELREEIARYYNRTYGYKIDVSEIMIVVGGGHGMYLVLESILDKGDEVIVHAPYYTPYVQQVQLAGGCPVILETREEEDFNIDPERLKSLVTDKTKAIIINTPNNPTGACFSRETMESISKIAIENNLLVICDEVYASFTYYEEHVPITVFEGMKERTITIGSFSKDYAMTGWRVGYVIAPSYIINCLKDINEGICYTAPSISQRAALYALRFGEREKQFMKEEYRKRVNYACERIFRIPQMSVIPPQGAFYLFVNIKKTGLSSSEVCRRILEEAHVFVIPGNAFGDCGEGYIRIACTVNMEKLKKAFDRIEKMSLFTK